MEAADATIDKLASDGRLNPALLLTMAKAYSAAKETDYTKEEVKDVMAHLYFKVCAAARPFNPSTLATHGRLCLTIGPPLFQGMRASHPSFPFILATHEMLCLITGQHLSLLGCVMTTCALLAHCLDIHEKVQVLRMRGRCNEVWQAR